MTSGTGAALSDAVTISDGNGRAEVAVTLGGTAGSYAVEAALVVKSSVAVSFAMTAVAPPQMSGLNPGSFTGGDTVTIQGTDLADTLLVEIGGTLARVLSASGTTNVTVALKYAAATLDETSGTYLAQSDPLRLEAGEYASFDPATLDNCAVFPDADASGALYLLAPQSVTPVADLQTGYRLVGDPLTPVSPATERPRAALPAHLRFHDWLRQYESETAQLPRPPLEPQFLAPAAAASGIDVGDRGSFRVCNDAASCADPDSYETVRAVARYVGQHVVIYEDENAPAKLSDQEAQALGSLFDDELYAVATNAFGSEPDVDQNGVVFALMTPVVNRLTDSAECHDGVITGFFWSPDVNPAFAGDSRSNQTEIIYSLVADPDGTVSCELSKSSLNRVAPVTFSHEMQHMIGYTQRVLVRGGDTEILWLNEGLSHLSEELAALHFETMGDQQRFSEFAIGNLLDGYLYLQEPGSNFVLWTTNTGTLAERGAPWLFLRWFVDQFGDAAIRRLVETTLRGAENLEAVSGEPFSRLLSEWFLANYVSDLPGFTAPSRLRYSTWTFRTTFDALHQSDPTRFPDPYPLNPTQFTGGAFNVTGTLRSGSGDFYLIEQLASQRGFTVSFENPAGGPVSGTVTPRLEVVRIR